MVWRTLRRSRRSCCAPAIHYFEETPAWVRENGDIVGESSIFMDDYEEKWESELNPRRLLERLVEQGRRVPDLKLMVGLGDKLLGCARSFSGAAEAMDVPVDYSEGPGEHSMDFV